MSVSLIESDFAELQKLSLSDLKIRFTLCKALSLQFRLFFHHVVVSKEFFAIEQ